MHDSQTDTRLSRITTIWTLVRRAHEDQSDRAASDRARNELMERYHGAAWRYILAAVGDQDRADELFQEFALRFVRGDFRRADPGRGRFRQYVKTALINLVRWERKRHCSQQRHMEDLRLAPADEATESNADEQFVASWREELLSRSWLALERIEHETGRPYFSILRWKSEHPDLPGAQFAALINDRLSSEQRYAETAVRKLLQRAREQFAESLLKEVSRSLEGPARDRLEEELIALKLHSYCRTSFTGRR